MGEVNLYPNLVHITRWIGSRGIESVVPSREAREWCEAYREAGISFSTVLLTNDGAPVLNSEGVPLFTRGISFTRVNLPTPDDPRP